MKKISFGKICSENYCIDFTTSPEKIGIWIKNNSVLPLQTLNNGETYFLLKNCNFFSEEVDTTMSVDIEGNLYRYSIRRASWLAIGDSIDDHKISDLKREYVGLARLVKKKYWARTGSEKHARIKMGGDRI